MTNVALCVRACCCHCWYTGDLIVCKLEVSAQVEQMIENKRERERWRWLLIVFGVNSAACVNYVFTVPFPWRSKWVEEKCRSARKREIEWVAEISCVSIQLSLAIRLTFSRAVLMLSFLSSGFNEPLTVHRNTRGAHYCVNSSFWLWRTVWTGLQFAFRLMLRIGPGSFQLWFKIEPTTYWDGHTDAAVYMSGVYLCST